MFGSSVKKRIICEGMKNEANATTRPTDAEILNAMPESVCIETMSCFPQYCAASMTSPEERPVVTMKRMNVTWFARDDDAMAV